MRNKRASPNDITLYLNEIARHLWSRHASVMIGSGFSKNAQKIYADAKDFPLWKDLGDIFYEKLYGKKPGKQQKYLDVLKLAGEVQATFGRSTLNQILLSEIPDNQYNPSELYEELLKLPWNDVFTTNYDTLLERAAQKIKTIQYMPIVNKNDLIWSNKPRIIKLHGSFPSNKPFIITEEDYRTYPNIFAPFINTVQQSLIENTLCLIGFSGNDPNFLSWIGWIRDNLGKDDSLRMFLIGILHLSIGQKRLLEDRNIIPVDLSLLPANYNKDDYEALKFLFKTLNDIGKQESWKIHLSSDDEKKEEKIEKEEKISTSNVSYSSKSFKKNDVIYRNKDEDWLKSERYHDINHLKNESDEYTKLVSDWKTVRKKYPNWIILPKEYRDRLHHYSGHINFPKIQDLKPPLDIECLFEFNWRNEKCFYSFINDELIVFYESIINRYNPYPSELIIEDTITPDQIINESLSWSEISNYWIELQLFLLSIYRKKGSKNKWQCIVDKLTQIKKYFNPEQLAKYHYERCLFAIFSLDITLIKIELASWECNFSLPFWEAKRAGIIAELGDITGAITILENALINLRKKQTISLTEYDYSLLSQEGHILHLLRFIKSSAEFIIKDFSYDKDELKGYNERLDFLRQYKCDPFDGLDYFESYLKNDPSIYKRERRKYGFEINDYSIYENIGIYDIHTQKAISFLLFFEELGMPFRLSNFYYNKNEINNAIAIISEFYPDWALVSCIRHGDKDSLDVVIGRKAIAFMTQKNVNNLAEYYLSIFNKTEMEIYQKEDNSNTTFTKAILNIIPYILARLCVKCSYNVKRQILDLVEKIYIMNNKCRYKGMGYFIQNLLHSFSIVELYQLLPQLLRFPIISQEKYTRENYIDPLSLTIFLENQTINIIRRQEKICVDNVTIDNLISFLSDINGKRQTAFMRLSILYLFDLLSDNQIIKFSKELWNYRDNVGFPDDTNFLHFAFLDLPHPNEIKPDKIFDEYILKTNFPVQSLENSSCISMTWGYFPIFENIIGSINRNIDYSWDKEKINIVLKRIIEWWNADKKYLLSGNDITTIDEFKARFKNMINIFIFIISPHINSIDEQYIPKIKCMLDELHEYSIPDITSRIIFNEFFAENEDVVIETLLLNILSRNEDYVIDSINAIHVLLKKKHEITSEIIKTVAEIIKYRAGMYLNRYLELMIYILRKYHDIITDSTLENILIGMGYLINETVIDIDDIDEIVHEKLMYRNLCAELTHLLKNYIIDIKRELPECILKWEEICLDENEFSEIRTTWNNCG